MTDFQLTNGERKMRAFGVEKVKIDNDFSQKESVSAENLEAGDCH